MYRNDSSVKLSIGQIICPVFQISLQCNMLGFLVDGSHILVKERLLVAYLFLFHGRRLGRLLYMGIFSQDYVR